MPHFCVSGIFYKSSCNKKNIWGIFSFRWVGNPASFSHLESLDLDELLEAVDDEEVPGFVVVGDVARVEPALMGKKNTF